MAGYVTLPEGFTVKTYSELPMGFEVKSETVEMPKLQRMTPEQVAKARELNERTRPRLKKTFGDYFAENVADMTYGAKKALSGATLGASDWALRKLGVGINEDDYLAMKRYNDGTDTAAKWTGVASEIGGNMLGAGGALYKGLGKAGLKGKKLLGTAGGLEGVAYGLTGSGTLDEVPLNAGLGGALGASMAVLAPMALSPLGKGLDLASNRWGRYLGNKKLIKQLQSGKDFTDVKMGDLSAQTVKNINNLRKGLGQPLMENNELIIPANVVKKLYNKRILNDKRNPKEFVSSLNDAIYNKTPEFSVTKYPQNQAVIKRGEKLTDLGFLSVNPQQTGQNVVKSAYRVPNEDVADVLFGKNRLGGTPNSPSSIRGGSPRSAALDDLLPSSRFNDNIILNDEIVNKNVYSRDFIDALADRDSSRTMRNSVMAGADDISERARILGDLLEHRKNGMYNADLELSLKQPQMARAENAYNDYFTKYGNETLPIEKMNQYYDTHPVAWEMIKDLYTKDPRAFDGIKHGSMREMDMLKRALRKKAGNATDSDVSTTAASKRAEEDLKTLMDSSFNGFRDINQQYAQAKTAQDLFESKLKKGLTSVGGATVSPFWSGLASPLTAGGIIGGYFSPTVGAATLAGLGGKSLMRALRRKAGRKLADGIIDEGLGQSGLNFTTAAGVQGADWLREYPTLSNYLAAMFANEN